MAAAAGINLLEGMYQLVHATEQTLFAISRRPGAAMINGQLRWQLSRLGKIYQPGAYTMIVIDNKYAGADNLVAIEEGRLLDDEAHVLETLKELLLHGPACGKELLNGL